MSVAWLSTCQFSLDLFYHLIIFYIIFNVEKHKHYNTQYFLLGYILGSKMDYIGMMIMILISFMMDLWIHGKFLYYYFQYVLIFTVIGMVINKT